MSRTYVFLIHGVGKQSPGTWFEDWRTQFVAELRRYSPFDQLEEDEILERHLHFIKIGHDEVFEGYASRWGHLAGALVDSDVLQQADLLESLRWVERNSEHTGDVDRFLWDNVLDAVLWQGFPQARAAVIARVAEQLVTGLQELLQESQTLARAHCVAHSLGTSVLHDALISLSNLQQDIFDPASFQWNSVTMVANTSLLLKANKDLNSRQDLETYHPYRSALRPGLASSITHRLINVRHRLDPITWPRRFAPFGWEAGSYVPIDIEHFNDPLRVHDFSHYLRHPNVHLHMLRAFLGQPSLGSTLEVRKVSREFVQEFPRTRGEPFPELARLAGDGETALGTLALAKYLSKAYGVLT